MDYVGSIFRPPSEANSLILQIAVGCSHNKCTFCHSFKDKKFYIKDMKTIYADIEEAKQYRGSFDKVFLADGDSLILPTEVLLDIIGRIRKNLPEVKRIGTYANTKAILKKTPEELIQLREAGLGIIYQGIETGNKEVLRRIKKGAFPHKQLETAEKIKAAGMLLSQTVLLGIGGVELSKEHAIDTGKHLSDMSPDFASALTVMIVPGTELHKQMLEGKFELPDKFGLLTELKLMLENMNVKRNCFFTSNHASNYLPIRAQLPEERDKVVAMINEVITTGDERILRPEHMRAL
ncbi:MAG: radical SAM protein [Spirochaetes bacterium]|nr:radical SAM protein [Spirochaetota bacterium]